MTKINKNSILRRGTAAAGHFRRKYIQLIVITWIVPPIFGLSFLVFIETFTLAQMQVILVTPLMPAYSISALLLAIAYFDYYSRPMIAWIQQPDVQFEDVIRRRLKLFPLYFWGAFLTYLLVASALVVLSGEIYTDYIALPVDWFRINLVALIVSILVGLPVFFLIFDLFGHSFGKLRLSKPLLTIKTRVFLIGALVPLLIDTMLVQYYWTRTGYFGWDTFIVWAVLELLAIAGSLLFMHSFGQSLHPLNGLLSLSGDEKFREGESLLPASTDELGIVTARLIDLLEELQLQYERLDAGNQMLRKNQMQDDLDLHQLIVDVAVEYFPESQCLLIMPDVNNQELIVNRISGEGHRSKDFYRLPLDGATVFAEVWREGLGVCLADAHNAERLPRDMVTNLDIHSLMVVPLKKDGEVDCMLAVTFRQPNILSGPQQLKRLETIGREITNAADLIKERWSHRRIEKAIIQITEAVSIHSGERFFKILIEKLADILGADGVGIGILSDSEKDVIETMVFWLDGKFQSNVRYNLAGTPCEQVVGQKLCTYGDDVQNQFPADDMLRQMGVESYIGAPMFGEAGNALGLQFAIFKKPLVDSQFEESVMRIFAVRVSLEIERQKKEKHINYLAYFDNLTSLPNRQLLYDRMQQAMVHAERNQSKLAVIMLDLDHFKDINDSLGHTHGDYLLIEVAKRLKYCVRDEDTVARLGGDEFVILLQALVEPNVLSQITRVAEKIMKQLATPYHIEGRELIVTPSMGVALFPENGQNTELLLKHADTAMYNAKDQGRNNYRFFSTVMNDEAVERLEMEGYLRHGLEENQFRLVFQPKVSIQSGVIIGAEALLRWHHPVLGDVSPDIFIPIAEETGLIIPIGLFVMEMACEATAKFWCQHGNCDQRMSINVSPRQFQQPDFIQKIQTILTSCGALPDCIEIEITEHVLVENIDEVSKKLHQLKEMGISIAIDDFGTGYSSLSYFKHLPLDHVKIDRSFVDGLPEDKDDAVIVQAILAMTQQLGVRVTAEGVETQEQLEFLRAHGCDDYQGYLYSRPIDAESFQQMLLEAGKT